MRTFHELTATEGVYLPERGIDQITAEKINYRMVFRFNGATVEDALSRPIRHDLHAKIREDLT